jgi:squalene-hopene/tetraprenyl-beta-curcumene cyclase
MPRKLSVISPYPALLVLCLIAPSALAGADTTSWKPEAAARYLDARQNTWFGYAKCISCHTGLPYALARPALQRLVGAKASAGPQAKLLASVTQRVANWPRLDSKAFGLYYDGNEQLKTQSWGTEAVFNAAILAFNDRYQGRTSPSAPTHQALKNLWQTQVQVGHNRGSWEWLDFGEAPWGNRDARYVGAALATIAVATAPGYYKPGTNADTDAKVALLTRYLKTHLGPQNLHNRAWALWASAKISGILSPSEQKKIIAELLEKQRADGSWSLPSLGSWTRGDGTQEDLGPDGYATALVLHVLQTAGLSKKHPQIAKGLVWLKGHQTATGAWRSVSLVKKRDPASHTGQFMSDAATAFAVLALSD